MPATAPPSETTTATTPDTIRDVASAASVDDTLTLRAPRTEDGAAIYTLVRDAGGLDLNSPYAYLLLAHSFAATSVVAETTTGELAGAVLGLPLPDEPGVLFVWQVGVHPDHRGRRLGARMLGWLVDEVGPNYLDATVTPTNEASRRLFRGFARDRGVPCEVEVWARDTDFPGAGHEREDRHRIGPLPR